MTIQDQINNYPLHDSMRGYFGFYLFKHMADNEKIMLLTGDLGYGLFDKHREWFPQRFINCGASEQAMLDIAVGLSYAGKIPVVYSITPFLIYRGFETIRTYINHEKLNIKLIGGGRDKDYEHDGFSHDASDVKRILNTQENIIQLYPTDKTQLEGLMQAVLTDTRPYFISLRR